MVQILEVQYEKWNIQNQQSRIITYDSFEKYKEDLKTCNVNPLNSTSGMGFSLPQDTAATKLIGKIEEYESVIQLEFLHKTSYQVTVHIGTLLSFTGGE